MNRFIFCALIFTALCVFKLDASFADSKSKIPHTNENTVFSFGDEKVLKFDLIREFLDAAFSKSFWNEESPDHPQFFNEFLSRYDNPDWAKQNLAPETEWLREYYYRPSGLPKDSAINKWTSEITVGVDWPHSTGKERRDIESSEKDYSIIETHVLSLIPQLQKATGVPIRFIKHTSQEDEAAIRIIPVEWDKKERRVPNSIHAQWSIWDGESGFYGAVQFQDKKNDGYLLPRADNSIGMAICKVNMQHASAELKKDIASCLLRSLGLPAAKSPNVNDEQLHIFLVRLLYCSVILPGMDRNKALDTLMRNEDCFSEK